MNPKEAVIAVTYRCNCRCAMCNIWKESDFREIPPTEYMKLPRSLKTVNITGGEPFLRPDLREVIRVIHNRLPDSRLVFSSNGLMSDSIASAISEFKSFHSRVGVGISIDGIGETHDVIRGVKGAYERALSTVKRLRDIGVSDLRLGMTIVPENVHELEAVHRLSKELGVEFTTTFAHDSSIYFKKTDNVRPWSENEMLKHVSGVVDSQLRSRSPKDWFRAFHTQGTIDARMRQSFVGECRAGDRYFFMNPNGDIFPCSVMNMKIGNITEVERWHDLMTEQVAKKVGVAVRSCRLDCWMVCNTRSLIISHPLKSGTWVLKNKLERVTKPW